RVGRLGALCGTLGGSTLAGVATGIVYRVGRAFAARARPYHYDWNCRRFDRSHSSLSNLPLFSRRWHDDPRLKGTESMSLSRVRVLVILAYALASSFCGAETPRQVTWDDLSVKLSAAEHPF